MEIAQQFEFAGFVPKEGTPKRVRTKWEEVREMVELQCRDDIGLMMSPSTAAVLLDVSRARVTQWMDDGRLRRFHCLGKIFVCEADIVLLHHAERATGRPLGMPPRTLRETYQRLKARKRKENSGES